MEAIIYVKPECKNNIKQVEMLRSKNHTVTVRNIFEEDWTKEKLRSFFQNLPLEKWHNPYAPRVKSGEINPKDWDEEQVLAEMIQDNYLIRRPLLRVETRQDCGFDSALALELMASAEVDEVLVCHQAGKVCD
ncbi:MAG: arsenate reductase family protein [Chlorobiales bacterium]|nr:arsenate reductase family protein [Chlorobiales bacterium]